jgi:hypothetical protein
MPRMAAIDAVQTAMNAMTVAASLLQENLAWAGGGVSSSISAGP